MSGSAAAVLTKPAFRKIEWLARDIAVERRPDGVIILKSRIPLQPYEKHIPASLAKWAREAPDRIWLAQRGGADRQWRKVSYGEAKRTVDGLTQGLLNLGVAEGRPVTILSGNSIEHALMTLAAADTARSSEAALCEARRTSRMSVVRSCHGISSWRTISSSRRAVDGQCTRRRSSPTTYSRSE